MMNYLIKSDSRSISVSKSPLPQDSHKAILQNPKTSSTIGGDERLRSKERQRKMVDVSSQLRAQMAQRLLALENEKQYNIH